MAQKSRLTLLPSKNTCFSMILKERIRVFSYARAHSACEQYQNHVFCIVSNSLFLLRARILLASITKTRCFTWFGKGVLLHARMLLASTTKTMCCALLWKGFLLRARILHAIVMKTTFFVWFWLRFGEMAPDLPLYMWRKIGRHFAKPV